MIPYGKQDINQSDIDQVVSVLKSDFLTQGPVGSQFESVVAEQSGAKYAVATNSATSALHIACLAIGVGPGDAVWTTAVSFVASSNCALYCGASVDFIDIDAKTYNMSTERLAEKLEEANKAKRLPKVVIPVHLAGEPCDMRKIHALAARYGFHIIEDASHAIGAKYGAKPVGSCEYSTITVFSFHPVKIVTTGEGGMALTNDQALYNKMARLRSHGITRDAGEMSQSPDGPWYYEQVDLGYNYRMTDIQAALGISQMKRLDEFVAKRHAIADRYDKLLKDIPVIIPYRNPESYSALHLYIIRLKLKELKTSQTQIFERLRSAGILVNLHYIPIYRQPYYRKFGYRPEDFPEAEAYYAEAMTLPLYPGLTGAQQDEVIGRLIKPIGHQTLF